VAAALAAMAWDAQSVQRQPQERQNGQVSKWKLLRK